MQYSFPHRIAVVVTLLAVYAFQAFAQGNSAAHNNSGVTAYKAGRYAEAIGFFEKAYQQAPDSAVVRRNLCNAYQSEANEYALRGDFYRAIRYLEAAIGVEPENASPFIQLGSYYLRTDKVDAGIERLEEAITLKPGDLDAHDLLGQAYYMDNDLSSARAQWDYVLEVAPDRPGLQERYEKAFREESVEYDFNRWKSRHFRISYPDDVPNLMRSNVFSILDRAYVEVGRKFGGIYPPPPIHVILYTAEQFTEATKLEGHVGAVYDGKIRAPLTDAEGNWLVEQELERRLTHEYAHVVVRHITGSNVPWWVNEGLAETMSKSLSAQDIERLRAHFTTAEGFSLKALADNQINRLAPPALHLAYIQSHAAVELLWNRYGHTKMLSFLKVLGEGKDFETAMQSVYRRNAAAIEQDLVAYYR
jgi:Tfp pilus assembly protein PilF